MDIPYIHCPDRKEALWFSEAVNEDSSYFDLFNCQAVKSIINLRWDASQRYIINYLFYPYLVYLAVYLYWVMYVWDPATPVLQPQSDSEAAYYVNITLLVLVVVGSLYFVGKEVP